MSRLPRSPPDEEELFTLAGARAFERGEAYLEEDAVEELRRIAGDEDGVEACVVGTSTYSVTLQSTECGLVGACSCPVGGRGEFCKHCVAVGLAWRLALESGVEIPESAGPISAAGPTSAAGPVSAAGGGAEGDTDSARIRAFLEAQPPEALVELVLSRAGEDESWFELLLRRTELASGSPDASRLRGVLDQAICIHDFVDYRAAPAYYRRADEALVILDELIEAGEAETAIGLAEHALRRLEAAVQNIDDSDGGMSVLLCAVEAQHLRACLLARPDPIEFARRMFDWRVTSGGNCFVDVVRDYADVLGEAGLAELHRLASAAHSRLPALKPGDHGRRFSGGRFAIEHLMEQLVRRSGDVDALVQVLRRSLAGSHDFFRIADAYREAGRRDEAIDWAEQGLEAFPDRRDRHLRAFLWPLYREAGRSKDALALLWDVYVEAPGPETFESLVEFASAEDDGAAWHARALDHLERLASDDAPPAEVVWPGGRVRAPRAQVAPDLARGALVQILVHVAEIERAWEVAEAGRCPTDALLELSDASGPEYHARSVRIYTRVLEAELRTAGKSHYRRAAQLCIRLREKYRLAGDEPGWVEFERALREKHKRRPSFQTILTNALRPVRPLRPRRRSGPRK